MGDGDAFAAGATVCPGVHWTVQQLSGLTITQGGSMGLVAALSRGTPPKTLKADHEGHRVVIYQPMDLPVDLLIYFF